MLHDDKIVHLAPDLFAFSRLSPEHLFSILRISSLFVFSELSSNSMFSTLRITNLFTHVLCFSFIFDTGNKG